MKKIISAILIFFSILSFSQESTAYYFIRHAEKNKNDKTDPFLTNEGVIRAEKWAYVFEEIEFDAVYSTNYNRTIQTVIPTAKANKLEVLIYEYEKIYNEEFKSKTIGKNILIVGHSNTTPKLVNQIINQNKYKQIKENNNSNLYIVTKTKDNHYTSILLKIQ